MEKKRARERLSLARKDFKRKSPMTEKARRDARGKSTLQSYFASSRHAELGAPLMLESIDVPGSSEEDSAIIGLARLRTRGGSVSVDTARTPTPGSSSGSGSSDTVVLSSKSPLIHLPKSSEEDDNAGLKEVPNTSEGEDEEVESPPKKGKKAKSEVQQRYDRHRKFQTLWAAKLPWAEGIMASDGILHMVKCKPCSAIDRKPCIMAPKSDTLFKHDGKRIAKKDMPQHKVKKGEQYVATQCCHKKNVKLYAARPPATILEQVNNCTTIEARKKRVQFASIFQILRDGRPMLDFESRYPFYKFLNVHDLPNTHWCDNSGSVMASYIFKIVTAEIRKLIQSARFLALSVDEVTTADNNSYLSLHCYVVQDWVRVPLLVSLQKVECALNAENLTKLRMESFAEGGGLDTESVARKLVSFGADGASTMQGCRAGVTTMVHDNFAPFSHGVHCVGHRCNLAFKALQSMGVFGVIERVLTVMHDHKTGTL